MNATKKKKLIQKNKIFHLQSTSYTNVLLLYIIYALYEYTYFKSVTT